MARTSTTSTSKRSSVRAPKTSSGTKRALVAARKLRRERAASWKRWCAANCWQPGPDTLYYEHLPHEIVMYRTYVKPHFQLNDAELSTLPCMELSDPERSRKSRTYVYSDIMNLVYRKFAVISGEDAYDCPYALLEKGRVLFDNDTLERERIETRIKMGKDPRLLSVDHCKEIASRSYPLSDNPISTQPSLGEAPAAADLEEDEESQFLQGIWSEYFNLDPEIEEDMKEFLA